MKIEAICSNTVPEGCPTVIDLGALGEFFRHVQLVEVEKIQLSGRTAVDKDGGLARCAFCNSELVVLRPSRDDALFALGRIRVTAGVRRMLRADEEEHVTEYQAVINDLMKRHVRGDWGLLDAGDRQVNTNALQIGDDGQAQGRILSAYSYGGEKLWVITERGRHETTVLLPEEY